MTDTIKTADILRLHDRLVEATGERLFLVMLAPTSRSHVYAKSEQAAREFVESINPNAIITSIIDTGSAS